MSRFNVCYDLANTTATLSVNLSNSVLTTVTWTAYYANTADTFGTLASPTRTQIATGTFTVSTSGTQTVIGSVTATPLGVYTVAASNTQTIVPTGTFTVNTAAQISTTTFTASGTSAQNFDTFDKIFHLVQEYKNYWSH